VTRNNEKTNYSTFSQTTVISGLGGVGKSELARKYAREYANDYDGNAIWIDAKSEGAFRKSFVMLLVKKYFIESEASCCEKSIQDLTNILFSHPCTRKCLLILDGVEELDIFALLPAFLDSNGLKPDILVTSRKDLWLEGIEVFNLPVLDSNSAKKFVSESKIDDYEDEACSRLVMTLQYLPLCLLQAIAYIKDFLSAYSNPIQTYLDRFNENDRETQALLDYENAERTGTHETSYTTWKLTMVKIKQKVEDSGELASHIMQMISCFHQSDVPISLMVKLKKCHSECDLNHNKVAYRAIGILKKWSMASASSENIKVNHVVQLVIRLNLKAYREPALLKEGIDLLEDFMHPYRDYDCQLVKRLLPHSESVWRHAMRYIDLVSSHSRFVFYLCEKLCYFDRHTVLLALAAESKLLITKALDKEHEDTIAINMYEALTHSWLGNHGKALEILEEMYKVARKAFGESDALTQNIFNCIALNEPNSEGNVEEPWEVILEHDSPGRIVDGSGAVQYQGSLSALQILNNSKLVQGFVSLNWVDLNR
jgi:hypothetical protein